MPFQKGSDRLRPIIIIELRAPVLAIDHGHERDLPVLRAVSLRQFIGLLWRHLRISSAVNQQQWRISLIDVRHRARQPR